MFMWHQKAPGCLKAYRKWEYNSVSACLKKSVSYTYKLCVFNYCNKKCASTIVSLNHRIEILFRLVEVACF